MTQMSSPFKNTYVNSPRCFCVDVSAGDDHDGDLNRYN